MQQTIYNYNPNFLAVWRAARDGVVAGSANARVLGLGDSITYGFGSNNATTGYMRATSFLAQTSALLNAAGVRSQSNGWMGDGKIQLTAGVTNSQLSIGLWRAGVSTAGYQGYRTPAADTTSPLAFTPDSNSDTFEVFYVRNSGLGHIGFDINGGAQTDQSTNGTASVQTFTKTATIGANVLNAKLISGDNYILGMDAYDASAGKVASFINAGWIGADAAVWTSVSNAWAPLNAAVALAPKLTIIGLVANDATEATDLAAYKTNLQTIITAMKAVGDVVLLATPPKNPAITQSIATQLGYVNVCKQLAVENNLVMVNMFVAYGNNYQAAKMQDATHPNGAGDADIAAILNSLLLR